MINQWFKKSKLLCVKEVLFIFRKRLAANGQDFLDIQNIKILMYAFLYFCFSFSLLNVVFPVSTDVHHLCQQLGETLFTGLNKFSMMHACYTLMLQCCAPSQFKQLWPYIELLCCIMYSFVIGLELGRKLK